MYNLNVKNRDHFILDFWQSHFSLKIIHWHKSIELIKKYKSPVIIRRLIKTVYFAMINTNGNVVFIMFPFFKVK